MPIAIQEDMLAGRSLHEKLSNAQSLGIYGVEFWADGLTERVPEIHEALSATGIRAAGVNLGKQAGYLSPDMHEREAAISRMRQAMANAVDLQTAHVIFVPHPGVSKMPDLTPYRSPMKLESEMMIWLLRTVSDLAYALGVTLHMQPVNRYESYFMNRLDQAALYRKKIKDHPHVKTAASLFHMALEEYDIYQTLRTHGNDIGYLHIADSNRRLPRQGLIDFRQVAAALQEIVYEDWLTLECGRPGDNQYDAAHFYRDLPESLAMLKQVGLA